MKRGPPNVSKETYIHVKVTYTYEKRPTYVSRGSQVIYKRDRWMGVK